MAARPPANAAKAANAVSAVSAANAANAAEAAAQAQLKFQQLRRQFHAGLAVRAAELEAAPSSEALHALLHRLVGAAGAFGDITLASQARALMHGLQAADEGAALPAAWQAPRAQLCAGCRELAGLSQLPRLPQTP